jgi:hypothetical protein
VHVEVLAITLKIFALSGDEYLTVRKIRSLHTEERRYYEVALRLIVFNEKS